MLESLKEELLQLHLELPRNGLVSWTSGNISARDKATGLVVIKPSGVRYHELTPQSMVVLDLNGRIVEGDLQPSTDTATHLYVYRHRENVGGVVHTHSPYATAWACTGKPIPVYLTAIADVFGQPIPCAPYRQIGGEEIGKEIVRSIGSSSAILMKNHGVFCIEATAEKALRAAVMVEDVARIVSIARTLGPIDELPLEEVARQHLFYLDQYGQKRQ